MFFGSFLSYICVLYSTNTSVSFSISSSFMFIYEKHILISLIIFFLIAPGYAPEALKFSLFLFIYFVSKLFYSSFLCFSAFCLIFVYHIIPMHQFLSPLTLYVSSVKKHILIFFSYSMLFTRIYRIFLFLIHIHLFNVSKLV